MAQAKKKTATKTTKKPATCQGKACAKKSCTKKACCSKKSQCKEYSNPFFLITMSMLAAALLFADVFMMSV